MRATGRWVLAATVAVVGGGGLVRATHQDRAQQPVFKSTVDLVQVDVVVTDADGIPIRGLTQGDFTVSDRGRPQAISAFDEVSHVYSATALPLVGVRSDVADNRTAQSQRLVVVVVDDLHIFRGRTDRAKDLTKQIINNLGPEASMALLFTSGEHGTEVTEDRSILLAAAETLKGRQAIRRPHAANDTQAVHGLDPEAGPDAIRAAIATVGSGQDFFENMSQFKTLEDAAKVVGSSDLRRKAFVLITEGINEDLTGVFTGSATPCELATPSAPCYHQVALRRAAESMRRSNVTMYALDPRGHVSDQDLAIEGFGSPAGLLTSPTGKATDEDSSFRITNPIRLAQDGLNVMAGATGGFAVTDSDDFSGGVGRILEDLDHYYLIGFLPADPSGASYRPLTVKVPAHPEYHLRFRAGYNPGGPPALPAGADPLLSGALPQTDVPLRLFAEAYPAFGAPEGTAAAAVTKGARVGIALEVGAPTGALLEADGKLHDGVTYKVVAVGAADGKVSAHVSREATLVLKPIKAAAGPPPRVVFYQLQTAIDLPPGAYQLRASASSTKVGAGGSVYLAIDVPDFSRSALAMTGLAIGYADGERVAVAPLPTPTADDPTPALSLPVPFSPTLDRVFRTTDTLRLFCQVRRASALDAIHVDIDVLGDGDHAITSSAYDFGPGAAESGALAQVDHRQALAALPPGPYRLRVTATHGGSVVRQELGFAVR
jgi:VWFA-related protein